MRAGATVTGGRLLLACAATCLLTGAANAPADEPVLTMQEAVARFRAHGFDLLLADAAVTDARGNVVAEGALPNPLLTAGGSKSFKYDAQLAGPGASSVGSIATISDRTAIIDTLLVGKRHLRRSVAEEAFEAARFQRVDAERILGLLVRQQFLDVAGAQRSLIVARDAAKTWDRTVELIEARLRAGVVSEADLARARTAALGAAQLVDETLRTLTSAKAELSFLLGDRRDGTHYSVEAALLDEPTAALFANVTLDGLLRQAMESRPDLATQRRRVEAARKQLTLSRRERVPDISLLLEYQEIGTGQIAIQPPTFTFMVELPLPILYWQQGEITSAGAGLRSEEVTLDRISGRVAADVESEWAAWTTANRRLARYREGMLAQAALARDVTFIQYDKGTASLLDFLDAQRTFVAVQGEYVRTAIDYWKAVYALEAAVGAPLQ